MFVRLTVSVLVNKILLETKIPSLIFCFLVYILPYLLTPGPHYEQRLLTAALGVHLPEMWPSVSVYPGPWPVVSPEGLVVVIPGGQHQT